MGFYDTMVANFIINFILNKSNSDENFHICFIWQLDNCITFSQWWKNDKVEKCRGGKISRVEIIAVEIIPFSVLSKLFMLFLINFVVITTFFTTYNLQLQQKSCSHNLQLTTTTTTYNAGGIPPRIEWILLDRCYVYFIANFFP